MKKYKGISKKFNSKGPLNKDIECFALAKNIIRDFQLNETIDSDSSLTSARQTLLNAIIFSLYSERKPKDRDFAYLFFTLNKARDEIEFYGSSNTLNSLWKEENQDKHTGLEEYEIFTRLGSREAAIMVIDNLLHNFKSPGKCKNMFTSCVNKMTESTHKDEKSPQENMTKSAVKRLVVAIIFSIIFFATFHLPSYPNVHGVLVVIRICCISILFATVALVVRDLAKMIFKNRTSE